MKTYTTYICGQQLVVPEFTNGDKLAYLQQHVKRTIKPALLTGNFATLNKDLRVFKKARMLKDDSKVIVNMIIPAGSKIYIGRSFVNINTTKLKCRADKAKIVSIHKAMAFQKGSSKVNEARSLYSNRFIYYPNTIIEPENKFSREYEECSSGIHFFTTLYEALTY